MHERIKFALKYLLNFNILNNDDISKSVDFMDDIIHKYGIDYPNHKNPYKMRRETEKIIQLYYDKFDVNSKKILFEELLKHNKLHVFLCSNNYEILQNQIKKNNDELLFMESIFENADQLENNYFILFFKQFYCRENYYSPRIKEKIKYMIQQMQNNQILNEKLYHKNIHGENIFTAYIGNYDAIKYYININEFIEIFDLKNNFNKFDTILSYAALMDTKSQIKFKLTNKQNLNNVPNITCVEFLDLSNFRDLFKYFLKRTKYIHMLTPENKKIIFDKIYKKYKEKGTISKYLKNVPFQNINMFLFGMKNYFIRTYKLSNDEIKDLELKFEQLIYDKSVEFDKKYALNLPIDLIRVMCLYLDN